MEDLPPAIHEIAVYTESLEIRGEVTAWPPRRILDVLNGTQTPYLTIEQAAVIPLCRWGKAQPTAVESIVLNIEEITLLWLIRETKVESREFTSVHKIAQPVLAYAGPFVARGDLHIIREATLLQALDAIRENFIALTDPSVYCLTVPGLTLKGGIILALNKDRVMAMQVNP